MILNGVINGYKPTHYWRAPYCIYFSSSCHFRLRQSYFFRKKNVFFVKLTILDRKFLEKKNANSN